MMLRQGDPIEFSDDEEDTSGEIGPEQVQVLPDGGLIITMGGPADDPAVAIQDVEWDANLAEHLSDEDLRTIGMEVCEAVERDDESRSEWKTNIKDGLDLLGFKNTPRSEPFAGACGVTYPMVAEAAIRFQSRAIVEMFPENGPVDAIALGTETKETKDQAERVRDYLNYHLTEVDEGYQADFDQMLYGVGTHGSGFRKVWYDATRQMVVSRWVLADDFIKAYGAPSLETSPRNTHVLHLTPNEIRRMQLAQVWRDVELTPISQEMAAGPIAEKTSEIAGVKAPADDPQARRDIYESHCEMAIEADPHEGADDLLLPYIVTVDKETQVVLAVRRGWREGDPLFRRRQHFVEYDYIAGQGGYGLGLIHIIGGLARGSTALLRMLVDTGTFAAMPGGFKARGAKPEQTSAVIGFGEWREIDTMGMPVRDAFAPLPYKDPSPVLLQLWSNINEAGRALGSISDLDVGDGSTQQPVGTVMALLENSSQIQSAIHKRLHRAQRQELRLIADLVAAHVPEEGYPYNVRGGNRTIMRQDFDERVDVVPVSDPKNFTATQRMMKGQLTMQIASNPQWAPMHKPKDVLRGVYQDAGIDSDAILVPDPPQPQPMDPISENLAAMRGMPVAVGPGQDHAAHSAAHLEFLKLPNAMQQQWFGPLLRHTVEHEMNAIWAGAGKLAGQPFPPLGQPMPPQVEAIFAKIAAGAMATVVAKINGAMPAPPQPTDPALIQAHTNAEEVRLRDERERIKLGQGEQKLAQDQEAHQDKTVFDYTELAADQAAAVVQQQVQSQQADQDRAFTLATRPPPGMPA